MESIGDYVINPNRTTETRTETGKKAKYSVVPSFFKDPVEIEAIDIVASINDLTGEKFVNLIGVDGRYYKLKEQHLGMLIINEPDENELADFARLRKEADMKEQSEKGDGRKHNAEKQGIYG